MKELSPAYLSAIAGQLSTLSAFLGGFAATFVATLLTLSRHGRLVTVTIGLAVAAAVAFVVTVVAATMVAAITNPHAPTEIAHLGLRAPRVLMTAGFYLGTLSLLATLGCSGWTHSRTVGRITTLIALSGAVSIFLLTIRVD